MYVLKVSLKQVVSNFVLALRIQLVMSQLIYSMLIQFKEFEFYWRSVFFIIRREEGKGF